MLAALEEFEAGLGSHGLPLSETTSLDASPENPKATYHYEARVLRDYAAAAIEERENEFKEDPSRARIFTAVRVDH